MLQDDTTGIHIHQHAQLGDVVLTILYKEASSQLRFAQEAPKRERWWQVLWRYLNMPISQLIREFVNEDA